MAWGNLTAKISYLVVHNSLTHSSICIISLYHNLFVAPRVDEVSNYDLIAVRFCLR